MKDGKSELIAVLATVAEAPVNALILALVVSFVLMWFKERALGAQGFPRNRFLFAFGAGVLLAVGFWVYGNMTGAPL